MIKYNLSAEKLTPATPPRARLCARVCQRVCVCVYTHGVRRVKAICGELAGCVGCMLFFFCGEVAAGGAHPGLRFSDTSRVAANAIGLLVA